MITEQKLILYLEELICELKNKNMTNEKKQELTLLYIQNKYKDSNSELDSKNNLKYISLGWYIYHFLINKN